MKVSFLNERLNLELCRSCRILLCMKQILLSIFLVLSGLAHAETESLRTFVRIDKVSNGVRVIRMDQGDYIPAVPLNNEIKKKFEALSHGTEALMEGHITYRPVTGDNARTSFRPFFIIEKINPVTLADLGSGRTIPDLNTPLYLPQNDFILHRPGIPVTTEVASALTLTTSMLLMQELTTDKTDPNGRNDVRKALFISAGAMATVLFLYEQITGKTKP